MSEWLALSRGDVDRGATHRNDEEWLARAWAEESTRVLVIEDGRTLVATDDAGVRLVFVPPGEAPAGERYLLGMADGTTYFAVRGPLPQAARAGSGAAPHSLRTVGTLLDDRDAGLMTHAVALAHWHASHTHCPRCGAPTRVSAAGHVRVCPDDGSQHFPRVDPAVIMLVHDGEQRCLLARQPSWPGRRFSVLAGFVEPGESLEQAVVREVDEEVGLPVRDARYEASQPWPFPASLMLGFTARADAADVERRDGEIAQARWYTREELCRATEDGSLLLPGRVSIARLLIERWYGGSLAGEW